MSCGGLYHCVGSEGGNVCVSKVFIVEGNNNVVVISENNPMKTNDAKKKKKNVIKNKEKIVFGFKFREQYK